MTQAALAAALAAWLVLAGRRTDRLVVFVRSGFDLRATQIAILCGAVALLALLSWRRPLLRVWLVVPYALTALLLGAACYDGVRWLRFEAEAARIAQRLGVTQAEMARVRRFPAGLYVVRFSPGVTTREQVRAAVVDDVARMTCEQGRADKYYFFETDGGYKNALNVRFRDDGTVDQAYSPDSWDDLSPDIPDPRYRCYPVS
jgi:hypothetical protein